MDPTQTMTPLVQLAEELDDTKVSPGILGFLVFALLGGAVWLLAKSMNRHLKRIDFDEGAATPGTAEAAKTAEAEGPEPEGDAVEPPETERAARVSPRGGPSTPTE